MKSYTYPTFWNSCINWVSTQSGTMPEIYEKTSYHILMRTKPSGKTNGNSDYWQSKPGSTTFKNITQGIKRKYMITFFSGIIGRKLVLLYKIVFNYHLRYTRCTFIRCVNGWTVLIEGSSFFVNNSLKNMVARQDQDLQL